MVAFLLIFSLTLLAVTIVSLWFEVENAPTGQFPERAPAYRYAAMLSAGSFVLACFLALVRVL